MWGAPKCGGPGAEAPVAPPLIRRCFSVFGCVMKHSSECFIYYIKNSQQANEHCEFFLIRCKHSQRGRANQFLR